MTGLLVAVCCATAQTPRHPLVKRRRIVTQFVVSNCHLLSITGELVNVFGTMLYPVFQPLL
jgi:hypothetical protein